MPQYTVGQVVKAKQTPSECPEGHYWRKVMGEDAFKLYPKRERQTVKTGKALENEPKLTAIRVAAGVRAYLQHEEGFKNVMQLADLSSTALLDLAAWCTAMGNAKAEKERIKAAALAKANAALREAGLAIGSDGSVQPITPAWKAMLAGSRQP